MDANNKYRISVLRLTSQSLAVYAVIISLFSMVLYLPGLGGGFTLDDGYNILQNRLLYVDAFKIDDFIVAAFSFHGVDGLRFLPMLSFALDHWHAGGMEPGAFKLTNVLIHGVTVFCLVFMLRRLFTAAGFSRQRAGWAALLLALLWGIHPLQVSSVLYVVQRMQTMASLFLILALWAYLAMRQAQINGDRARCYGVLTIVLWLLALLCKEDAALLLAYTFVLELTILGFKAGQPSVGRSLRRSYLFLVGVGAFVYFFAVVPHYWYWDAAPGRDFSTLERLLTQGRVLVMYLYQIVVPWPDNMPFIYDAFPVSRGLFSPWTTLPALILVFALLAWAWVWRQRRPLFSCGVMLFFAGHFIASNVIALELVFEHRNHFPLIGALLALMDLLILFVQRFREKGKQAVLLGVALSGLVALTGSMTVLHAYTWGDPVRHGIKLVELSPESPRAWIQYGNVYSARYNETQNETDLIKALQVTEDGLEHVPSMTLASNAITYKAMLGEDATQDWQRFYQILENAPRDWQNKRSVEVLMNNVRREFDVDKDKTVKAMALLDQRWPLSSKETLEFALFVYRYVDQEKALPWLKSYAQRTSRNDPSMSWLLEQLIVENREDWADQLRDILAQKENGDA